MLKRKQAMNDGGQSPFYKFFLLTVIVFSLNAGAYWFMSVTGLRLLTLFLGLEGMVSFASALAPNTEELSAACNERGFSKLRWWAFESWKFQPQVSYFPMFFYLGLLFLGASIFLSVINE